MTSLLPKTLLFRRVVASPLLVVRNHVVVRGGYAYKSFSSFNHQDYNISTNFCCVRRNLQQQQRRTLSVTAAASQQPPIKLANEQRTTLSSTILSKKSRFPGGWTMVDDRDAITKTFNFIDFKQAWEFMSQIAIVAEQMNHHPEWMNVYNRVEVTLTTHDVDGLSNYDVEMAQKMDEIEVQLLSGKK